jgi:hypothetical protein
MFVGTNTELAELAGMSAGFPGSAMTNVEGAAANGDLTGPLPTRVDAADGEAMK